tara:strand:- start:60 stop:263 length:204 start_codon:yes stop_codon:yes gene_type:complete
MKIGILKTGGFRLLVSKFYDAHVWQGSQPDEFYYSRQKDHFKKFSAVCKKFASTYQGINVSGDKKIK